MQTKSLCAILLTLALTACGTLTGIPSHGGGKRFAIEQELVAASARAAVKNMDLHQLQGKRTAVYVSIMGDQGSGTISGGRYSLDALIRGEYANIPASRTEHSYPRYTTTATTESDGLTGTSKSTSLLNAPSRSRTETKGASTRSNIGLNIGGMGDYRNETLTTNPQDATFLDNIVRTVLFLRGIEIAAAETADAVLFVNVDVFGTIRSRTEMHLYNAETLRAQTKLEYFAIDTGSRKLLIKPHTEAYEAAYKENYALWMGPYKTDKHLKPTEGLMADFTDIQPYGESNAAPAAIRQPETQTEAKPENSRPDNPVIRKRQGAAQ